MGGLKSAFAGIAPPGLLAFASLTGAVAGITAVVRESTLAASDLDESMNKVNVVFGRNADSIQDWARTTSTEIGISRQAALEAAGTYGNLFTALGLTTDAAAEMSMSTVQLAADLASFNNEDPSAVLLALRSGLSGEMEPLKRFGIAMNQAVLAQKAMEMGLGDNIQALSEAEKVQVRYAVIMEQTASAQGDFARTSDGLANTQRAIKANFEDIKAILGEEFLPDVNAAAIEIKNFTSWIVENAEEIKKWANILSWANPGKWGVEIGKTARELFGFSEATDEASDSVPPLVDNVGELPPALEETTDATKAAADAAKELTKHYQGLIGDMESIHDERERATEQAARLKEQEQSIKDELVREQLEYGKLREERELTQEQIDDHVLKMEELNQSLQDNADAQMKLTEDTQDATKQRIADTVLERLSKDELTSAEYEFYQNYLVQQGLITAADRDRAIGISQAADSIVADFERQNSVMDTTQAKINALVNGSPYNIKVNIETTGNVPSVGGSGSSLPVGLSKNRNDARRGRSFQEGGSFIVPGTGRGDRPFLVGLEPGERVDVTPRNGSNNSVVINITGILDRTMVNRITQEVTRAQVQ